MLRAPLYTDFFFVLFLLAIAIIALVKLLFENRTQHFFNLIITSKYLRIYVKDSKPFDVFNSLLSLNFILSLSLFVFILLDFDIKNAQPLTLKLSGILLFFFLIKIFIEQLVGYVFDMEKLIHNYLFYKISYKNFFGILFIPVNALFIFLKKPNDTILTIFTISLILIYLNSIFSYIKLNFDSLKKNFFYFILYLCALEISPYILLYLITINL